MRLLFCLLNHLLNKWISEGIRDGKWRAITIEVTRADAIARARPGYFAR